MCRVQQNQMKTMKYGISSFALRGWPYRIRICMLKFQIFSTVPSFIVDTPNSSYRWLACQKCLLFQFSRFPMTKIKVFEIFEQTHHQKFRKPSEFSKIAFLSVSFQNYLPAKYQLQVHIYQNDFLTVEKNSADDSLRRATQRFSISTISRKKIQ